MALVFFSFYYIKDLKTIYYRVRVILTKIVFIEDRLSKSKSKQVKRNYNEI